MMSNKKLMLGNEAIARGAYEAGVTVATAYPGTPSTEITEYVAQYDEIYAEWSPNEKVAMEVAIGSAIGGARTIVSMKHVGLNVAADPLFTVSYTGINAGLVILVADDPGMHSSQNEQDSRYYARSAHIPMLEPSDSAEAKSMVKLGLEMSEAYGTPVFMRLTTRISHSQSIVELKDRENVELKPYVKDITKYVMVPGMARARHVVVEERMKRLASDAETMPVNREEMNSTTVGVITSGISYQYVKESMPEASILKLGMVHPLPKKMIESFAGKVKTLYVVEELEPIFEEQIKAMGINVIGKALLTVQGEYSVNLLKERLMHEELDLQAPKNLPQRPPVLCPGCPHRGVFYVLDKLKKNVSGDIGCYALAALPPLMAMDFCVCMGASISMLHGIEKARGKEAMKDWVSVIGDSTFCHSGVTGLMDVVYNKGISTVIILDNSTTGMTGHQDNPSTGLTIKGEETKVLNLVDLCRSVGIERIRVVDPFELADVEKAVQEETAISEPSVIIACRPCELLNKSDRLSSRIQPEVCKRCGMCMKLGCPAIEKKDGQFQINDAICCGCNMCVKVCRFDAIVKEEKHNVG